MADRALDSNARSDGDSTSRAKQTRRDGSTSTREAKRANIRATDADEAKRVPYQGPYVQNQKIIYRGDDETRRRGPANSRRVDDDTERGQTIDSQTRAAQAEYSSVKRSRAINQAARERTKAGNQIDMAQVTNKSNKQPVKNASARARRGLRGLSKKKKARFSLRRFLGLRLLFIVAMALYLVALLAFLVQLIGLGLAAGLAATFEWIPFVGDNIVDGALTFGFLIFGIGWMVASLFYFFTNLGVCVLKNIRGGERLLILALSIVPLLQIFTPIVWLFRSHSKS